EHGEGISSDLTHAGEPPSAPRRCWMGRKNSVTSSAPTPSPNADEVQQEMAVGRSASARIRDRASRSLLGQEPYMTM
ncbi:Os07g0277600, partial [Oryza sativa Japonica Group]